MDWRRWRRPQDCLGCLAPQEVEALSTASTHTSYGWMDRELFLCALLSLLHMLIFPTARYHTKPQTLLVATKER